MLLGMIPGRSFIEVGQVWNDLWMIGNKNALLKYEQQNVIIPEMLSNINKLQGLGLSCIYVVETWWFHLVWK